MSDSQTPLEVNIMLDRDTVFEDLTWNLSLALRIPKIEQAQGGETLAELGVTGEQLEIVQGEIAQTFRLHITNLPLNITIDNLVGIILEYAPSSDATPVSSRQALNVLLRSIVAALERDADQACRELDPKNIFDILLDVLEETVGVGDEFTWGDRGSTLGDLGIWNEQEFLDIIEGVQVLFDVTLTNVDAGRTLEGMVNDILRLLFN